MGKNEKRTVTIMEYSIINPKTTDVDEHIDLINTLGDMVDQKEEAKKGKVYRNNAYNDTNTFNYV